jgi:dihydrofolate reductase
VESIAYAACGSLTAHGNNLLDELRLVLHPVVVGSGQQLSADGPRHRLELIEQQALSVGVFHLLYRPAA